MPSIATSFFTERHRWLLACSLAVVAHISAFALVVLPQAVETKTKPNLSITLTSSVEPLEETVAETEEPQTITENLTVPKQQLSPAVEPTTEPASEEQAPAAISIESIESFVAIETEQYLQKSPGDLPDFEATFAPQFEKQAEDLRVYKNLYGEVHVEARLGNQTLCYQGNINAPEDDWGFNLVMFYACTNKHGITLNLK